MSGMVVSKTCDLAIEDAKLRKKQAMAATETLPPSMAEHDVAKTEVVAKLVAEKQYVAYHLLPKPYKLKCPMVVTIELAALQILARISMYTTDMASVNHMLSDKGHNLCVTYKQEKAEWHFRTRNWNVFLGYPEELGFLPVDANDIKDFMISPGLANAAAREANKAMGK